MMGAAAGLALGFLVARRGQSRKAGTWEPTLVEVRQGVVASPE